jgi:hypothetical protein
MGRFRYLAPRTLSLKIRVSDQLHVRFVASKKYFVLKIQKTDFAGRFRYLAPQTLPKNSGKATKILSDSSPPDYLTPIITTVVVLSIVL